MDAYTIANKLGRSYAESSSIRSNAPLSGEWAGDITIPEVYRAIEEEIGRELTTDEYEWVLDDWESGYFDYWDETLND